MESSILSPFSPYPNLNQKQKSQWNICRLSWIQLLHEPIFWPQPQVKCGLQTIQLVNGRVRFVIEVRVWVRVVVQVMVLSASTCFLLTHCMFSNSAVRILPVASGWTVRYELLIHRPYAYTVSNTTWLTKSAALNDGSSSLWSFVNVCQRILLT